MQRVELKKKRGGSVGKFQPEFTEQVKELCKLGATDRDLSLLFGVHVSVIDRWKRKHPQFFERVHQGKQVADIKVSKALFTNAIGFYYYEEQLVKKWRKKYDNKGNVTEAFEVIEMVEVKKYCKPDTTAQIFWLKNRRRDLWRDGFENADPGKTMVFKNPNVILAQLRKEGFVMLEGEYDVVEDMKQIEKPAA